MCSRIDQHADENELVSAAVAGDHSSLSELYRRYFKKLVFRCLSFVKDEDIAYDLAQDVFLKAIKNLPSFHQHASFSSWLYTIATNHCLEHLRREKQHQAVPLEKALHVSSDGFEQETAFHLDLLESKLQKLLKQLNKQDRILLVAKYCQDVSIKDLQEEYKLSSSAIKMRLKRLKEKLAVLLNQADLKE